MTTSSRDASGIIWVGQLKCNPGRLDRSVVTSTDCFFRLSIHRLQQFKDSLENGDLNGHNMAVTSVPIGAWNGSVTSELLGKLRATD